MEFVWNRFRNILIKDAFEFGVAHTVQLWILALIIPLLTFITVSQTLTVDPSLWFFIAVIIGLFISTNVLHSEIHSLRRNAFLMVPASMFEKLLSRFLIISIGFSVAMALACLLGWLAALGLNQVLYQRTLYLREDWLFSALNALKHYIILQPVFVLAGLLFKRKPIIKMILVLLALCFTLLIGTATFSTAIIKSVQDPAALNNLMAGLQNNSSAIGTALKYGYWFALAPVVWVVVFIRLRRVES